MRPLTPLAPSPVTYQRVNRTTQAPKQNQPKTESASPAARQPPRFGTSPGGASGTRASASAGARLQGRDESDHAEGGVIVVVALVELHAPRLGQVEHRASRCREPVGRIR